MVGLLWLLMSRIARNAQIFFQMLCYLSTLLFSVWHAHFTLSLLAHWSLFWGPVLHCRILQILNLQSLNCRKRLQGSIVIQMLSKTNCSSLTVHLHWRAPKIRHLFINSSACWIPVKHSFISSHHFDSAYKYVTCSFVEVSCATMSSWGVHNPYRFISGKFRPVVGCSSATWSAEERCSVWQVMGACWPAHTAWYSSSPELYFKRKMKWEFTVNNTSDNHRHIFSLPENHLKFLEQVRTKGWQHPRAFQNIYRSTSFYFTDFE